MACYITKAVNRWGQKITMFICGDLGPHCAECPDVSDNQCDFPVGEGKTCDRYICNQHSNEIAPDIHYCTAHFYQWQQFVDSGGVRESLKNIIPFRTKT